jgi:probable HAF family extracellular repeat protein
MAWRSRSGLCVLAVIVLWGLAYPVETTAQQVVGASLASDLDPGHAFLWSNGVMTPLETLSGGSSSVAYGINASGQAVGLSSFPDGTQHAVLWSNGGITDLGNLGVPLLGLSTAVANGINASGQVVGYSTNAYGFTHAFLWSNGVMTDLGSLAGATHGDSYGLGINASGQVVGVSTASGTPVAHPFLWSNGVMTDLGFARGGSAYAINDSGQVVVYSATADGSNHAFLWSNGAMTDLGTLGGTYSIGYGINDSGQVVGYSTTADGSTHAFLWSNGAMTDLGTLGGTYSIAYGINASGQVVGVSGRADGSSHAFLWSNGAMTDLKTLGGPYSKGLGISDGGKSCAKPTYTGPYPTSSSPGSIGVPTGWHMSYNVSGQHGLELTDVSLGSRYMAESMNLPFFYLETSGFSNKRCTLTPTGDPTLGIDCTSRLIDFTASGGLSPEIKATYEVDNIPSSKQDSCLVITQDYKFSAAIYPALQHVQGCEPSDSLPCAKFQPMVSYQFFPGSGNETLTLINTAQQLHFAVSDPSARTDGLRLNSSGIFKDCDILFGCSGIIFQNKINPLLTEVYTDGVLDGHAGDWDNFHQTFKDHVQEPLTGPGCPECVHIHWRWGKIKPFVGGGSPILSNPQSNQDVYFAVVKWHPGEQDPIEITDLVNGEPLNPADTVFWYSAIGYQDHDTFFYHGGFFAPQSSGPATLTAIITKSSGPTETINLVLTNSGPGTAHGVSINELLPRLLRGSGAVIYTGPPLPSLPLDLTAGQSINYTLPFYVPPTVQEFSLTEGVSFQDDFGTIQKTTFAQVVIP